MLYQYAHDVTIYSDISLLGFMDTMRQVFAIFLHFTHPGIPYAAFSIRLIYVLLPRHFDQPLPHLAAIGFTTPLYSRSSHFSK